MSDKRDIRFWIVLLACAVVTVALVVVGLRLEQQLEGIETRVLDRAPGAVPLETLTVRPENVAAGQTVFVPVYSHIYSGGGSELLLEATLTIRNTDPDEGIVVESVRYYDTAGNQVREYLEQPIALQPLATADFLVERRDRTGGVGANFLVDWVAEAEVNEPWIEAVMVGSEGNQAIAFGRTGRELTRERSDD